MPLTGHKQAAVKALWHDHREQEDRLAALQRQHVEDEMGRRGYEALMQQLQQGMSVLGSRLAMLESAADRDTGNAPKVRSCASSWHADSERMCRPDCHNQ